MPASIRLPSTGASYRLTAMLSGSGAGFSMGLILCLCGGLIACFAVLSAQLRQPVQAVEIPPAMTADQVFNARYYPLADCPLFPTPRQRLIWFPPTVIFPEPPPLQSLPTGDPSPKIPLYPISFPAASLEPAEAR